MTCGPRRSRRPLDPAGAAVFLPGMSGQAAISLPGPAEARGIPAAALIDDGLATLWEHDFAGSIEVRGAWEEGYGQMMADDGGRVKRQTAAASERSHVGWPQA